MESLIDKNFRGGTDRPLIIGDFIRFKIDNNKGYYYGIIDRINDSHSEVSYGTLKMFQSFLKRERNLDFFGDVDNSELELFNINGYHNFNDHP